MCEKGLQIESPLIVCPPLSEPTKVENYIQSVNLSGLISFIEVLKSSGVCNNKTCCQGFSSFRAGLQDQAGLEEAGFPAFGNEAITSMRATALSIYKNRDP